MLSSKSTMVKNETNEVFSAESSKDPETGSPRYFRNWELKQTNPRSAERRLFERQFKLSFSFFLYTTGLPHPHESSRLDFWRHSFWDRGQLAQLLIWKQYHELGHLVTIKYWDSLPAFPGHITLINYQNTGTQEEFPFRCDQPRKKDQKKLHWRFPKIVLPDHNSEAQHQQDPT